MNAAAGPVQTFARHAAKNIARDARKEAQKTWQHIQLRDIPRTCLPSDIRRMLRASRVETVTEVHIDYHRFLPTGRAYLKVTHPDLMEATLRRLSGASITSLPISATPFPPPTEGPGATPTRGVKGFAQAAERGIISGNGPSAGVSGAGRNVALYGLPGRMSHEELREHLRAFQLAPEDRGQRVVVKLDMDGGLGYSMTARHLVKMASESEAHRLVRKWHMMPFQPKKFGERYIMRAQVIN